jgi:hypothetical protein
VLGEALVVEPVDVWEMASGLGQVAKIGGGIGAESLISMLGIG